jgi:hypothetical protein
VLSLPDDEKHALLAATSTLPDRFCSRCDKPIAVDNKSGLCQGCWRSPARVSHPALRDGVGVTQRRLTTVEKALVRACDEDYEFGILILEWMIESGYDFTTLARDLPWHEQHLRTLCCVHLRKRYLKGGSIYGIERTTIRELATRLACLGARGWSASDWERELMQRRPDGKSESLKQFWRRRMATTGDVGQNHLARALRKQVQEHKLTRIQAAEIGQVRPRQVSDWMGAHSKYEILDDGTWRKRIILPELQSIAGVARILAYPAADDASIEAAMQTLLCLMAQDKDELARRLPEDSKRLASIERFHALVAALTTGELDRPLPAGIFLLREIHERGLSIPQSHPGDPETLYRYIETGRATDGVVTAVADTLKLSTDEKHELARRTKPPLPRDEVQRAASLKATHRLKRRRRPLDSQHRSISEQGEQRREAAYAAALELGPWVHYVDRKTFARHHGIRESVAREILRLARQQVDQTT